MEQDNLYKKLLEKGSEKASPSFTNNVMEAVNLATKPFAYQALVPPVVKRIFISIFIALLVLIFVLCLFIAVDGIDFSQFITLPDISPETFKQTVTIILLFWAIYAANYWMAERRKMVSSE